MWSLFYSFIRRSQHIQLGCVVKSFQICFEFQYGKSRRKNRKLIRNSIVPSFFFIKMWIRTLNTYNTRLIQIWPLIKIDRIQRNLPVATFLLKKLNNTNTAYNWQICRFCFYSIRIEIRWIFSLYIFCVCDYFRSVDFVDLVFRKRKKIQRYAVDVFTVAVL